jgi:hypothetical protein
MKKECLILIIFLIGAAFLSYFWFLPKNTLADSQGRIVIKVQISVCGNNIKEGGEQCDGTDLGGATCQSLGFSGGTLSCSASCNFNTSACISGGGGGGGGGGGYPPPPTTILSGNGQVNFTGKAYPNSTVTLLKDAQIVATTIAGADANFQISLSNITAGSYIFSIYSEDKNGNRSSLLTFPVSVTQGVTTNVSGIFIAPTIDVDKAEIKKGEVLKIFGQSAPNSEITIIINSEEEIYGKTKADKTGAYLYNLDTLQLEKGDHLAKSRAILEEEISPLSKVVSFKVGNKTVLKTKTGRCGKADLNCDGRVNLVDFSIAAYWYKRTLSSDFKAIENERLNGDNKIDLIDFSIMAYYWTG